VELHQHCYHITSNSRTFLESHNEKLPKNYQLYPGKMDHTTCVAFFVNGSQTLQTWPAPKTQSPYIPKATYPPHCLPLQPSIDDILTYEIPAAKVLISGASGRYLFSLNYKIIFSLHSKQLIPVTMILNYDFHCRDDRPCNS